MESPDPNAEASPGANAGHEPSPPSPPLRPDNRYEERDVSFRAVLIVAIASGVIGAVIFFAVRGFYWAALESRAGGGGTALTPGEKPTEQLPPEPRLELLDRRQKTPPSNVSRWERGEEKTLETYGPTDEKGFVRIPLERAMDALAGHLPARPASEVPKFHDKGLVDAGESNSGRMFRGAKP